MSNVISFVVGMLCAGGILVCMPAMCELLLELSDMVGG